MSTRGFAQLAGLDCIQLAGISANGRHGVYPEERRDGQVFIADVDMYGDLSQARSSDDVADTTDYGQVAAAVRDILEGDAHDLIETVADKIAHTVLSFDHVDVVRVRVHKPQAPLDTDVADVAVTVWAGLDDVVEENAQPASPSHWMSAGVRETAADFPGLDHRPSTPRSAVLALGANLGEREQTLRDVVGELDHWEGIGVTEVSPLVRTAAVLRPDQPSQPDYVNAVVVVQTLKSPRELLEVAHELERRHGRTREEKWGPRTLDIDIISYEGVVSEDPTLTLPHPEAASRAFVLVPWQYIRPHARLNDTPISQLAQSAQDRSGIRSIDPDWLHGEGTGKGAAEALPLPRWSAVRGGSAPRIIDDPEALVVTHAPSDPRLSLERRPVAQPLGIAGVSSPHGPRAEKKPSLWERIKAFFTGRKTEVTGPVVDAEAVAELPRPLPAAQPQPVSVLVDDSDTAVEGVDTRSLRQLDTAAIDQVAGERPASGSQETVDEDDTPAGYEDRGWVVDETPLPREGEDEDDEDEGVSTQPISLAEIEAEEEREKQAERERLHSERAEADVPHRQSLKDRLQAFSPVPPPQTTPPQPDLPKGLADKFAQADLTWGDHPTGRHAAIGTDTPPPPPLGDAAEQPTTHEVTAADIAAAGDAAHADHDHVVRPTTTGTIPVLRDRIGNDGASQQ